jgi:hypothetical protein
MKYAIYTLTLLLLFVMFQVQDKIRKPKFNRMYNVWQEDEESIKNANGILVLMLAIAFLLGLFM